MYYPLEIEMFLQRRNC